MVGFGDRLAEAVDRVGSIGCVGLDPHAASVPLPSGPSRAEKAAAVREFCLGVIDAVRGVVPAVKPQVAFFEALGAPGVAALEDVCDAARNARLLVVLDAKRGDIGSTAEAYAHATLDGDGPVGADAVTLSPYLGAESLAPFLKRADAGKGLFVLLRTSNPGAGEWQAAGEPSFADRVAGWIQAANAERAGSSGFGPVGAVVGATLPAEARRWREALPNAWLLVPGFGAQGATAADVGGLLRRDGLGARVVSARGVLFPAQGTDGADWRGAVAARARAFRADLATVRSG